MNILAIAGSPRLGGNSTSLLKLALREAADRGHEVALLHAVKLAVRPCMACDACKRGPSCVVKDGMLEVYAGLEEADALVIATPVHFYSVSGWLKPVVDRCYALFDAEGEPRIARGKKLFVITAQADEEPADGQATVRQLARSFAWLGMELQGSLTAAGLDEPADYENRPELLDAARRLLVDGLGKA
jgi:multimeric flavodoxin WrbA